MMITTVALALALTAAPPKGVEAKEAMQRYETVFLFAETMLRGATTVEDEFVRAMDKAQDNLLLSQNGKILTNAIGVSGLFLMTGQARCEPGEKLADCFLRLPIKRYVEAVLVGETLRMDRYEYGSDGKYVASHHEVTLDVGRPEMFRRQALNIGICLVFPAERVKVTAGQREAACREMNTPPANLASIGMQPWVEPVLPGDAQQGQPAPMQPALSPPEGKKDPKANPEKKSAWPLPISMYWTATIVVGACAIPPLVVALMAGVGSVVHGTIAFAIWRALDAQAADRGLSPGSTYRTGLAVKRNGDLTLVAGEAVLAGLLLFVGVSLGVTALGLVAYGFSR